MVWKTKINCNKIAVNINWKKRKKKRKNIKHICIMHAKFLKEAERKREGDKNAFRSMMVLGTYLMLL